MKSGWYGGALACALLVAPACGPRDQLDACEITQAGCQEDVYYAVIRLRGDGFDPFSGVPPIETLTSDEYRARLESAVRPASDDDDEPAEPPINPWDRALQLLGLLTTQTSPTQASIDDRVQNIKAFYSSGTGRVTVIDDGRAQDGIGDTATLAHELVHAFQERDTGLGGGGASTDASFARRAVVEGEATLYEMLAVAEMQGMPAEGLPWDDFYGGWLARRRELLHEASSPYFSVARWFVYPLGGGLLTRQWLRGGNAGVRAVWRDPPPDSLALMRGALEAPRSARAGLACESEAPAGGFEGVGIDRMGALQLYGLLVAHGADDEDAWELSLRWRDDRLFVYFDEDAREVALSYRVRFEDPRDAERARDALAQAAGLEVDAREADLTVDAADDPERLRSWDGADCR